MPVMTIHTATVKDLAIDRPTHGAGWDTEQVFLGPGDIVPNWVPADTIAHLLANRLIIEHAIAVEETKK
ncbi:hypothetical protein [Tessaracoccus defluvii]|uniref:Uncharacterized protein n=1 Tax=Tessaracoccus defluvii TaxID=1285901 RepID=A0A7H0H7U7_9ACTN|nr:hypothetical protein [Tessaracoccus defluvii]QNP56613.1 hypothetical protein H9L22_04170 [Tessaracoccus defluvii]